jgi:hypothetical protein
MSITANESEELSTTESESIKVAKIYNTQVEIETPCLICGEGIPTWFGVCSPKVCNKCRDAVMAMRKKMEE